MSNDGELVVNPEGTHANHPGSPALPAKGSRGSSCQRSPHENQARRKPSLKTTACSWVSDRIRWFVKGEVHLGESAGQSPGKESSCSGGRGGGKGWRVWGRPALGQVQSPCPAVVERRDACPHGPAEGLGLAWGPLTHEASLLAV